jgi:DNA-directed RNA polymerase specialized sigma24 family protein
LDAFARQFERPARLNEIACEAEDDGFSVSRLVDALRAASPKQREALRRHYLDGQPLEHAGRELSIDQTQLFALQTRLRALVSRNSRAAAVRNQRTAGAA